MKILKNLPVTINQNILMSRMREKFLIFFPSSLIALMPLFLITGPFLSDLSVVLIGIIFFLNICIDKNFDFLKNKFFFIFIVFFVYLIFNSLIKYYDIHSIRISLGYIRYGLFFMGIFYFLKKKPEIIRWLFFVFLFCYIALIFDGYYQYFFKLSLWNLPIIADRVSSFFGDELILGSYLSRTYPIFLGLTLYLYSNKKTYISVISIIFILIEVLVFLSGERSALFFNTLAAIFIIIMIKDFKLLRALSFLIALILIVIVSNFDNTAKIRIIDSTIQQMGLDNKSKNLENKRINIFSVVHESHYKSAFMMYLDNKFIGIGLRNFRNFCNDERYDQEEKKSCSTHPHNTYIQILSETGLIGLSFIIGIFFYFVYKCCFHLKSVILNKKYYFNNFEICLLASVLITIWPFIPTGNFFNNWISIIYYYPIGFFIWSLDQKRSKI